MFRLFHNSYHNKLRHLPFKIWLKPKLLMLFPHVIRDAVSSCDTIHHDAVSSCDVWLIFCIRCLFFIQKWLPPLLIWHGYPQQWQCWVVSVWQVVSAFCGYIALNFIRLLSGMSPWTPYHIIFNYSKNPVWLFLVSKIVLLAADSQSHHSFIFIYIYIYIMNQYQCAIYCYFSWMCYMSTEIWVLELVLSGCG